MIVDPGIKDWRVMDGESENHAD